MKAATSFWLQAAESDHKAITRLAGDPELTGVVAFHAQQCIEKTFKAVLEEFGEVSHKIHNLVTLYAIVTRHLPVVADEDMLDILNKLYIDSRYPGAFGWLPDGLPTQEEADEFALAARSIYMLTCKLLNVD